MASPFPFVSSLHTGRFCLFARRRPGAAETVRPDAMGRMGTFSHVQGRGPGAVGNDPNDRRKGT